MESVGSDDRYFEGLLTVQMKDKQGEVTIVDELYKVLPVWIDRGAPISDTHTNRIVGKGINYSRTTVKNDDGEELPAIKITGKIFKNYELDNVIWEKIKNNEYKGLSFGGATRSARSPIRMKDGSTAYALGDLEHYEVAVCNDPAVPMAIITDFNQIAKANFNSSVRDDGKMVIQCDNMGCYVNKDSLIKIEDEDDKNTEVKVLDEWKNDDNDSGEEGKKKSDLLTVMEGDKPENYNEVEAGKQRGRAIDKTDEEDKDFAIRERNYESLGAGGGKADTSLLLDNDKPKKRVPLRMDDDKGGAFEDTGMTNKFMEKKEMMDAVEDLPEKKDIEKAIEILEKAGYRVDTEDRNNGTEINDLQREKRQFNGTKGTLSEKLPMDIQQANLNESQTFEQKVQALIREGKSRESAEKIVGSFVHKVEASSGSGGAGIGGANMTNGGTLTTDTDGTTNAMYSRKKKPIKKVDDEEDEEMPQESPSEEEGQTEARDISNTGSGGTTEQAFNQNPPNAQRLNNKADDNLTEDGKKVYDEVKDHVKQQQSYDMYKSDAIRKLNKVHALMKLNAIKKLHISGGVGSRGLGSEGGYTQGSGESTQVTNVHKRPEDDRVKVKTPKE